ncbi:MAG: amidohydrolase family protein [Acidimicrobiaceae bacterium]|nr:amidohydrolase family protein [Acidimicrobiaceae bacterium]MYD07149.1 amidohydrolase family protein [Acidimicrobiaceae bacterium]MYI59742.1 amidohydrolase family protein [Acidimicrobiaceae bacterium]
MIDYWCNAFTPDREPLWAEVISREGLSIRTRSGDVDDGFCEPAEMVKRMDQVGVDTLVLPVCEPSNRLGDDPKDQAALEEFAHYAVRESELKSLVATYPGRFVGVFSVNPDAGAADLADAAEAVDAAWCVGLHSHTHSWDRPFDHPDYRPYYELCAQRSIPFTMQAGASGGNMVHESGHPSAIAKPARDFPDFGFVLSHTGAPWVFETIEAALEFPNVYVGTATHPPRRWPDTLVEFMKGPGRHRCLFGTGFPLTGHVRSMHQLQDLALDPETAEALLDGNARCIFNRIPQPDPVSHRS